MSLLTGAPPGHYDRITIPTIWVAFALSLIFHALTLFGLIPKVPVPFEEPKLGKPSGSLAIRLVPRSSPEPLPPPSPPQSAPPSPPSVRVPPAAPRAAPQPKAAQPRTPQPPVIALEKPSTPVFTVPPPVESARSAPGEDLAAYIASRRRAREGTPAPPSKPAENEQERHNRIAAENLGLTATPTFGNDPQHGGGVFQIRSMGYDIAEFAFFGWNKDINRNSLQVIEVRRGDSANMEQAVARRMISIIRERSNGDFQWQSRRLGKGVWLSSRPADTAELEAFILKETFPDPRPR